MFNKIKRQFAPSSQRKRSLKDRIMLGDLLKDKECMQAPRPLNKNMIAKAFAPDDIQGILDHLQSQIMYVDNSPPIPVTLQDAINEINIEDILA